MRWRIRFPFPTFEQLGSLYLAQIGICGVWGCCLGASLGYKHKSLEPESCTKKVIRCACLAASHGICGCFLGLGLGVPAFYPLLYVLDKMDAYFHDKDEDATNNKDQPNKE